MRGETNNNGDSLKEPLLAEESVAGVATSKEDPEIAIRSEDTNNKDPNEAHKANAEDCSAVAFEPLETVETEEGADDPDNSQSDNDNNNTCLKKFLRRWIRKGQYIFLFPLLLLIEVASLTLNCNAIINGGGGYFDYPSIAAILVFVQFILLWLALLLLLPSDDRPLGQLDVLATYVTLFYFVLRGEFLLFRHSHCFYDDYFHWGQMVRLLGLSLALHIKNKYFEDNPRKQQLLVVFCSILSFCSLDFVIVTAVAASLVALLFRCCPCLRSSVDAVRRLEAENPLQQHNTYGGVYYLPCGGGQETAEDEEQALQARLERQIAELGGPVGAGSAFLERELHIRNMACLFLVFWIVLFNTFFLFY